MATIKFECKKSKRNTAGKAPIYLRITHGHERAYHSTGFWINPERWNPRDGGKVRKSSLKNDDYQAINAELQQLKTRLQNHIKDLSQSGRNVTLELIKEGLKHNSKNKVSAGSGGFIAFMTEKNELIKHNSYNYYKRRKTVITHFRDFLGGDTPISNISYSTAEKFYWHLRREVGQAANTANKTLRTLKGFYNKAIDEDLTDMVNPFSKIRMRAEPSAKTRLSQEDLDKIERQELDFGTLINLTRDVFLFQVYTAGMRFSDVCLLTWKNVESERISYQMKKSRKIRSIARGNRLNELLNKYHPGGTPDPRLPVFPVLRKPPYYYPSDYELAGEISRKNALINKYLKKLQALVKIEKTLTTHVARHTFSELARKNGWSVLDISSALGHTDVRTTQGYLDELNLDSLDENMKKLFG